MAAAAESRFQHPATGGDLPADVHLEHFIETPVVDLEVLEGSYAIFGRVLIHNNDGDPQDAYAWIKTEDGDELDLLAGVGNLGLEGGGNRWFPLQRLVRVDKRFVKIQLRCATYDGEARSPSLIAMRLDDVDGDFVAVA